MKRLNQSNLARLAERDRALHQQSQVVRQLVDEFESLKGFARMQHDISSVMTGAVHGYLDIETVKQIPIHLLGFSPELLAEQAPASLARVLAGVQHVAETLAKQKAQAEAATQE